MFWVVVVICLATICQADEEIKSRPKPFGVGLGPAYVGGRETDSEGEILVRKMYSWYINYKRLTNKMVEGDEQYYERWYANDACIGSCSGSSRCVKGICFCDPYEAQVQVYGQCVTNTSAYFTENSDNSKFRKPIPPPIPEWCYRKKKNGGKEIDPKFHGDERCEQITYPNNFDHNSQFCSAGDHSFCSTKDLNMFCSTKTILDPSQNKSRNFCECRKDMKFDRRNMECRIHLDVDCTYVSKLKDQDLNGTLVTEMLTGRQPIPKGGSVGVGETTSGARGYTDSDVETTFCNLIDRLAEEYNEHFVPPFEFSLFGLGFGALAAVCCGSICAACCCCKCCNSCREKIRSMDPRNATRGMGTGTQMAALGVVAAGEYMDRKGEREDDARVAAMQGGAPGAPPGYAPVPTGYPGYPPEQAGYPQGQAVYPPVPAGYPPAPAGYPPAPAGYPPAPAGYPPVGQPGYIPPPDKGLLGDVAQMAPELALAGAGVATGNTMMAGMGAVAAFEKMDRDDEKEDRFRAAAMKGVPPPPMGYAGGPTPGAMPSVATLPAATANYPRQQMQ